MSTLLRQALRVFSKARLAPVLAEELLDHLPKIAGHDHSSKNAGSRPMAQEGNPPGEGRARRAAPLFRESDSLFF
ncbi:hypothetical protein, partial [Bifidobacterium asteroides]|uniref:hypothetical protein n=1 Tax=Bifidobacterium asteroides TaxID=1684 RepID=UPI0019D3D840